MVDTISRLSKVSEAEAGEIYKSTVQVLSRDGTIPREVQERMISFQRKALKIEKEVPAEQVYDFGIIRSLNQKSGKAAY